jgi:hypothetical protein
MSGRVIREALSVNGFVIPRQAGIQTPDTRYQIRATIFLAFSFPLRYCFVLKVDLPGSV